MSNKLAMRSPEKTSLRLDVSALTKAQIERLSSASGLSINAYANALLDSGLSRIKITEEDRARADEIIRENIAARNEKKAQKGIR